MIDQTPIRFSRFGRAPRLLSLAGMVAGLAAMGVAGRGLAADSPPASGPGSSTAAPAPGNGPHIVFESKQQTRDSVPGGDSVDFAFVVRNTGNADLKLLDVHPGCGCTLASFDTVIPPGATGAIRAVMHTQPLWGQVVKTLQVFSNDPADPSETLYLVAKVTPLFTVTPDPVVRLTYDDASPITRTIHVQFRPGSGAHLVGPPAISGPLTSQVAPSPGNPAGYDVSITFTPPGGAGDGNGEVDVPTDMAGAPPVKLVVVGLGQKGISISPGRANFGMIASDRLSHDTISIFSRGSTFHIQRLESDDPVLKVQYTRLPGTLSWYNVTVTYAGGWKRGVHQGTLAAYTDLPAAKTVHIPYEAEIE
jgi:hypothetical protein